MLRASCYLSAALLLGCSATKPRPNTSYEFIMPAGAETYTESDREVFRLGDRIGDPALPIYPSGLVFKHLPEQHVCIEIDIDTTGRVFDSRLLYDTGACPSAANHPDAAFLVATKQAVQQWRFGPARMCTFPEGMPKNDECEGKGVKVEPMPIRLAFVFSFAVENGGPTVKNALIQP